jgi:hypothetical protein
MPNLPDNLLRFLEKNEGAPTATTWLREEDVVDELVPDELVSNTTHNQESQKLGEQVFESLNNMACEYIRIQVLKDPWHVFDMIPLSKNHGLLMAFSRAVRDAMFVIDPEDRKLVEDCLKSEGSTWDDKFKYQPKYLWRLVRQTIPPPEELYGLLASVFKIYGPLQDATTGKPTLHHNKGTQYAVIAMHTTEEKLLFTSLSKSLPSFNVDNKNPDWVEIVQVWNRDNADGVTIFYKVNKFILRMNLF